jgi:CheY-like chemotaxis protein
LPDGIVECCQRFVNAKQQKIDVIAADVYDLLRLDVLMKGIDGFELYNKMRKIDAYISIKYLLRKIQ